MSVRDDVLIVGAGVIGLSCAFRLARRGLKVTLLDSAEEGQASQAAGGMLAPLAEAKGPGPFLDMGLKSLAIWASFASELSEYANEDFQVGDQGMLRLLPDPKSVIPSWQLECGLALEKFGRSRLREAEPLLSPRIEAAIYSPSERSVEPRRLLQVLREACKRIGVSIRSGTRAESFRIEGNRIIAAQAGGQQYKTECILLCGGAWNGRIAQMLRLHLPMEPIRGQAVTFDSSGGIHLKNIIYGEGHYLIPRRDGRIYAGASEERVGFDALQSDAGFTAQQAGAQKLIPALAHANVVDQVTGLRPFAPDGLPVIGSFPPWENLMIAGGHGRNGILLSPLTADWIADEILLGRPVHQSFSPLRFETLLCLSH